jgi:hypothetical protein
MPIHLKLRSYANLCHQFVQTLVAMDTCCGLDLIHEDMVPNDAIKQYVADAPCVRDANGRLVNLSAAVSLEVSIADQVFKITLFGRPTTLCVVDTEYCVHGRACAVPPSSRNTYGSILCGTTGGRYSPFYLRVKLAKAYSIPPKREMAVLAKADREDLSLLKPLYVMGRLLYACNGVSCIPAPGEFFLITISNFGDTFAYTQPGTSVEVATIIEHFTTR